MDNLSKSTKMGLTTALVVSACVVDSVTIAYDGSVMGSVNVMTSYSNYFHLTTATTAVNSTATYLGSILIAPFCGYLVDKRGRKEGIMVSAILNIIGAIISGAAQNIGMFIAGRMIVGLGVGLAQTAASTYVSETTAPKTAELDPSNWAWRIPSLLQAFAPLCILCIIPILPESPRWLINQDRLEEALQVLARVNGSTTDDPVVQVQYQEIIDTLEYEKREGKSVAFREIVRNAPNRKRLFLALSVAPLTMLTGSNVITYYYGTMLDQVGITSSKTQLEINLILSAWQFVVAMSGSMLAEKIGRRKLCLGSLAACTVLFYVVGGMTAAFGSSSNTSGVYGTVAVVFLYLGAYSFGLTPLTNMYPPEVLSYNIRATGLAMFTLTAKACGIFVTMVFPYMFAAIGWKTYIVNASWNILFFVWVFFFWVETKGKTLEEVDVLFDGVKHSDVPDWDKVNNSKMMEVTETEI
ncbi:hexose transporter [Xylariales sp. PMI_506]|nr:hexose transporter [Xylariales sp. PMI_506]